MSPVVPAPDDVADIAASPPGPQVGACFDLDGTLVAGITATAHATDRIRRGQAGLGEVVGVLEAAMRYRLGRVQFDQLVERAAGYLRGESLADLDVLGERLFTDRVASRVYPRMREIVHAHQQRGHTVVLCSSALSIHAEPVARSLGINHLLCNHFEVDERGVLTGSVTKPIIWATQKAIAVQRFCADIDIDMQRSYFYADGDEDAPLMSLVGQPRPVNPRPGLAALAAQQGWPVLRVTGAAGDHRPGVRRDIGLGSSAVLRAVISNALRRN
jgi:HAD superfamily hydrolase (TIGR01490 family)